MKTISTQKDLKKFLNNGEKEFTVTNKRLLKALVVAYWIQNNKVKGSLLLTALVSPFSAVGVGAAVGAGVIIGRESVKPQPASAVVSGACVTITITAAEIIAIGVVIVTVLVIIKGQTIDYINVKEGVIKFK